MRIPPATKIKYCKVCRGGRSEALIRRLKPKVMKNKFFSGILSNNKKKRA